MSLAILFHFLCTQYVSDINISIIRSLRLCYWVTTSVVLFSVRCVFEIWCGWVWVLSVLQAEASAQSQDVLKLLAWVLSIYFRKMLKCKLKNKRPVEWYPCCMLKPEACNTDTTPTQPHRNSNTHRTKNNTTNMVIQQTSRKLLMTNILMSETCWAHKKWNKITSDIKLVFYSSTVLFEFIAKNVKRSLPRGRRKCAVEEECRHNIIISMVLWGYE